VNTTSPTTTHYPSATISQSVEDAVTEEGKVLV